MHFRKAIAITFFLLITDLTYGCDICGGFMGITPYDNQSHVALYYRLRTFNNYYGLNQHASYFPSGNLKTTHQSHDPSGMENSVSDFEEYRVTELRCKFYLSEKTEISFSLPYYFNSTKHQNHTEYLNGLGDVTLTAGHKLLNKTDQEKIMQRLVAGAGVKLPTGNYEVKSKRTAARFDAILQPGTGTTDLILFANYLASYKNAGINFISSYRVNGENKFNERAGNGFTGYLNFFYKLKLNTKWVLIPSIQNYYEYSQGMFMDGESSSLTQMNVLYSGPGLDIFYKNLQWNCSVQLKMLEQETDGKMQSALKLTTGFIYNFNQSGYLFKRNTSSE